MNERLLRVLALSIVLSKYIGIFIVTGLALSSAALAAELMLFLGMESQE
ncbi:MULTISPECIES: hypothetical protein [unclassified Agarivorans]|nr:MULTISPECIES: hypothetical protein [unclassified Agarivorans]MDO6687878.1 hypothetical protein [Agarivorans sp. 3_MG-2023]MDO6717500.1 hypothetical protein [Agarivorans sp. 2_MG-2023]MDO6763224.1 hypothetical protein [Agarivorans sp. 1_MG-2023]GDY26991.1 hypothetical protein AHAT_28810 [Agarivorans sp. Toyoura001]